MQYRKDQALNSVIEANKTMKHKKAVEKFERILRECAQTENSKCAYTPLELRDYADDISPGYGNTGVIWNAADIIGNPVTRTIKEQDEYFQRRWKEQCRDD